MRNIAKRTLALVLSFVMIFTSLPTIASAKNNNNGFRGISGADTMNVGETKEYEAVTNSNAKNGWTWSSDNENVVRLVEATNSNKAKFVAVGAGETKIRAIHDQSGTRNFEKTIKVIGEKFTYKVSYMFDGKEVANADIKNIEEKDLNKKVEEKLDKKIADEYTIDFDTLKVEGPAKDKKVTVSLVAKTEEVTIKHVLKFVWNNQTYKTDIKTTKEELTRAQIKNIEEELTNEKYHLDGYDWNGDVDKNTKTIFYKAKQVNLEYKYPEQRNSKTSELVNYKDNVYGKNFKEFTEDELKELFKPQGSYAIDTFRYTLEGNEEDPTILNIYVTYKTVEYVNVSYKCGDTSIKDSIKVDKATIDYNNLNALKEDIKDYVFLNAESDRKGNVTLNYRKEFDKVYTVTLDELVDLFFGNITYISGEENVYTGVLGMYGNKIGTTEFKEEIHIPFTNRVSTKYFKVNIVPDAVLNAGESYNCNKNGSDLFDRTDVWKVIEGKEDAIESLNKRGVVVAGSNYDDEYVIIEATFALDVFKLNVVRWYIEIKKDTTKPVYPDKEYVNIEHAYMYWANAGYKVFETKENEEKVLAPAENGIDFIYAPVVDAEGNFNETYYGKFAKTEEPYVLSETNKPVYNEETNTITFFYNCKGIRLLFVDEEEKELKVNNGGSNRKVLVGLETELTLDKAQYEAMDEVNEILSNIKVGGKIYKAEIINVKYADYQKENMVDVTVKCTYDAKANCKHDCDTETIYESKDEEEHYVITVCKECKQELDRTTEEHEYDDEYRDGLFCVKCNHLKNFEDTIYATKRTLTDFSDERMAKLLEEIKEELEEKTDEYFKSIAEPGEIYGEADLNDLEMNLVPEKSNSKVRVYEGIHEVNAGTFIYVLECQLYSKSKRKPKNDPNKIIPDDPMPQAGPILNDLRTNRPNDSLTRSEFVAVLSQIFQVMDTGNYKDFNDIENDPNKVAIQKMSSFEIVKGYVDGSFGPNDFMTREQMYAILARAIKFSGKASALTDEQIATELAKVLDGESVSDWAKIDVATAIEQGIVGADTVNALETITRAETADKLEKFIAVIATESEEIKD